MGIHSPGSYGGCLDSNILGKSYRKNSSGPVALPAISLINIELRTL